ncbi:cfz1-like protein [Plasmopara halstedii]|uniref:Cfz1-like protein n=1 Tax=Plasmopara halstedii TaxID=4781 RepID=A0A0P1AF94_PLAHL|nr:cfz1-like protein [Plasmopara halstedii]CEG39669.1 cfz1-like protein [Plasmopara halstedii]|eukprot:XP_024576038.1 cfz1-like protein [Plasmopara halstedii]
MSTSPVISTINTAGFPSSDGVLPSSEQQKRNEEGAANASIINDTKDSVLDASVMETTSEKVFKSYPNVGLSLQKDPSWMLGDADNFGSLGPIPSMNTVLEKRTSSQLSINSLLPPCVSVTSTTLSTVTTPRKENMTAESNEATTDNEGQGCVSGTALVLSHAKGSGGNTKYINPSTGDYMYPDNVKPMSFYDKQCLVQKITMLPSQYLRGLMDVISKYQPDTVRQIDDDGYAFDLGQMNENTVWAISDYVKDSMIELDGYIKSLNQTSITSSLGEDDEGHESAFLTSAMSSGSTARNLSSNLALNKSKMSAITSNENQNKFLEQVEMYSKPKVTKSRIKPSKKHECPTCNKQFRGRSELQNHIRTHTGEKPLKCSYSGCSKRYAHSSNLRAHERTHAGIKPYVCHYDGCGKSFAHSVSLKEHIWMHAGFQPYVCPYEGCLKKFTQVSNFARHKKTHEKEENEQLVDSDS